MNVEETANFPIASSSGSNENFAVEISSLVHGLHQIESHTQESNELNSVFGASQENAGEIWGFQLRTSRKKSKANCRARKMQSKISAFYRPSASPSQESLRCSLLGAVSENLIEEPDITVTYKRTKSNSKSEGDGGSNSKSLDKLDIEDKITKLEQAKSGKVLNKKRNYAQLHLELGQSNFLWHTCKICGFKYATGDEGDEKVHKTFHKNYTHGVPFKGWRSERIIDTLESGRVILVQDGDPPAQHNKVQEVVHMMEMELGEGWILDKTCKAFRFVPSSVDEKLIVTDKEKKRSSTTFQFGGVSFQRELIRKDAVKIREDGSHDGVILCEDETVPAVCGIRAIWVSPSNRRKHIATGLLDAVRRSFCENMILDPTQLAFSQPTSLGKALICSYTRTSSYLVYTTANID